MAAIMIADVAAVHSFLRSASPRMTYACGAHLPARPTPGLDAIRWAYNRGEIDLVQRRTDDGVNFDYLAIKRRRLASISDAGRFGREHLL